MPVTLRDRGLTAPRSPLIQWRMRCKKPVPLKARALPIMNATPHHDCFRCRRSTRDLSHPDELTFQVVHQSSEIADERRQVGSWSGPVWAPYRRKFPNCAQADAAADAMLEHPIRSPYSRNHHALRLSHHSRLAWDHGSGLDSPGFLSLLAYRGPGIGEGVSGTTE